MDANRPRKRDSEATRARILAAAQHAFSQTGYSHTGIRQIAAMAGTSSTLLLRYYGSKIGLFEAALRDAMPTESLMKQPPAEFAQTLALVLRESRTAARPMLMMAMASGEREAAEVAARVFMERSIVPVGAALGNPDGNVRALELAMLSIGFVFFLGHLPLDGFGKEDVGKVCDWFTRSVLDVVESPAESEIR